MNGRKLWLSAALVGGALLCHSTRRASSPQNPWASLEVRYVSWEPTTVALPTVANRKLASEYLATGLQLWKEAAYLSLTGERSAPMTFS